MFSVKSVSERRGDGTAERWRATGLDRLGLQPLYLGAFNTFISVVSSACTVVHIVSSNVLFISKEPCLKPITP